MASTSSSIILPDTNSCVVDQFCSITGSTAEKAKKMLEICNWNLEMAVNMHVDSDFQETPCPDPANGVENDVRPPIPPKRAILVDEDISFHYSLRGQKRRAHTVFDGLRDFQAEAEIQEQPSERSLKKKPTLEDLFRPPLDIMHRGNFQSARDLGQSTNRWLMVNLQDSQEFACQVLNRDVWSNKTVKKVITDNFIFWQVYSDSSDGERYMQFYKPADFPYIAILDPITGEKLEVWNDVDSSKMCKFMSSFLRNHGTPDGSTSTSDYISGSSLLDQSEEDQLRAAIEASMQAEDPIDVEENDSDLETFDSDSENMIDKQSDDKVTSNVHSDLSNDIIDVVDLPEKQNNCQEYWKDCLGPEDDPKSELVIRLPDGKKEQVSWPCTTKLKSLVLYVAEMGYNYKKYELITNFPRRNLCQLDESKTLKEVDLFPREMVFVQLKT